MKFINLLVFSTALVAIQSFALDLPTGEYQFANLEAISTQHIHRLYSKSPKESKMITDYRLEGYSCKRVNTHITECKKRIEVNPNKVSFETAVLEKLSPKFSENILGVKELSKSELVSVYEIEQKNSTDEMTNDFYKAYDISESGFYVDLKINDLNSVRFEVKEPNRLSHFSYQVESLSKREQLKHGLLSYYEKN